MSISWRNLSSPSRLVASRLQTLFLDLGRWTHTLVTEGEGACLREETNSQPSPEIDYFNMSTWKVLDSRAAGIRRSSVLPSTWKVLRILQSGGFQAYLVGGCVRDLLLRKTPKDFDVVTTASLQEVKKQFHRVIIVGNRFPVCRVYIRGSMIEVSSFETANKNAKEIKPSLARQMPSCCDHNTLIRWRNCLQRDFTINSLFYDPCTNRIYDYVNGIQDIMASKVRTVIPAHLSFEEDCARILRGLRIAARLGLAFSKETAVAIRDLSSSVVTLNKRLLSCVDKLLSADRPSDCSLWLALLAFHLALLLHPQDALVVWTFSSILYYGGWKKATEFAKESAKAHVYFVPEIRNPSGNEIDDSLSEDVSHFASLVRSSISALINPDALVTLMVKCRGHDCSGLVFVSQKMGRTVAELFAVLETNIKSYESERKTCDIDYDLLKKGDQNEIRFVLGKVILDAMSPSVAQENEPDV